MIGYRALHYLFLYILAN